MSIKQKVVKEFPMPHKCGRAWKVGGEWHQCHLPEGHTGPCECSHYIREKEPLFEHAHENTAPIQFIDAVPVPK